MFASKLVGCLVGKSAKRISLRSDGELLADNDELIDPTLSRKASSEAVGARTANRHR